MTNDLVPIKRSSSELHPRIYLIMVGLAFWLILSVWTFAANANVAYLMAVVSGFILMAVAIPTQLWRAWRKQQREDGNRPAELSLREWAAGQFETWQYRASGASTATEILLPIAAVAFGMTAFGIAYHLVNWFG